MIVVDAMGGDHAPAEICRGAVQACRQNPNLEIALVGKGELIGPLLDEAASGERKRLHIVPAEEVIAMDETPAVAIRKKRKASLCVAMHMVRSGEAQGCVSAGNTGAIVAGGVLIVGRIPGIDRPGLGVPLPTQKRMSLLLDVGGTIRCKPLNLYQFALMGEIYMRSIWGVKDPEIALLSNGEEEIKGDDVVAEARELIRQGGHRFVGYVEGKDIPVGLADVVVTDGFTGNILLKFAEGVGRAAYDIVREEMGHRLLPRVGVLFLWPMLRSLWHRFDYERYGGTPLLGVNGAVIKAHGRSKAPAIENAIKVAQNFVDQGGVHRIRDEIVRRGDQA